MVRLAEAKSRFGPRREIADFDTVRSKEVNRTVDADLLRLFVDRAGFKGVLSQ